MPSEPWPPAEPRRTSTITLLAAGLRFAAAIPLLVLQGLLAGPQAPDQAAPPGLLLFGLPALILMVQAVALTAGWVMRTWLLTPTELVIDEGVVTRHHRVLPYDRVQQVDLERKLLDQVFGVATLRIDTAGEGGSTSAVLGLLDVATAERIRSEILIRRDRLTDRTPPTAPQRASSGSGDGGAPRDPTGVWHPGAGATRWEGATGAGEPGSAPPVEVLALSPGRLVVAALTSLAPVVVLIGLVVAWFVVLAIPARSGGAALRAGTLATATVVAIGFLVLTAAASVINDWGWRLERTDDQLHLRAGLTTVRHLTMPLRRVQHVTISDNPLRRALGLRAVAISSAASPTGSPQQVVTRLIVPVAGAAEVADVLRRALGGGWEVPELTPRPDAARRRAVIRRVAVLSVPALVALAVGAALGTLAPGIALCLLVPVGVPWGLVAHRRAGWADTGASCVLAKGVLHHRIAIVPVARLQSARADDNPFQRRSGLRSLHLDVAGDDQPLTSGPFADTSLDDLPTGEAERLRRELPRRSGAAPTAPPRRRRVAGTY